MDFRVKKRRAGQGPKEKTAEKVSRATLTFATPQEQFEAEKQTVLVVVYLWFGESCLRVQVHNYSIRSFHFNENARFSEVRYTMYTKIKNIIQKK